MNEKTKRYADLIDGVLELANTGLSSEDYTALMDELKRELVFPKQCPMAAPGIPCTYAHRHHGPHSWEKQEALCLHGAYGKGTCFLPHGHTQEHDFTDGAGKGAGRLGHLKPPLGKSPFCAYDKCDNPPTAPGRYCCVHDDPSKARGTALDPVLAHQQTPNVDQHANVPSGKSMLLDGPAPTSLQVAHLRNEVLEEVARDIEALNACIVDSAAVARTLRNLKRGTK